MGEAFYDESDCYRVMAHQQKESVDWLMDQISHATKRKREFSLKRRWIIVLAGLIVQGSILAIAFASSLQPGQPDVTLAPVAGNPNVCSISHVTTFTDAWVNGIQPVMLVHIVASPFPDLYASDVIRSAHCQNVAFPVFVQVIDQNTLLFLNTSSGPFNTVNQLLALFLTIIFSLTGITIFLRANDRPVALVAYGLFYLASLIFFLLNLQTTLWINVLLYILGLVTWGMATTFICLLPYPTSKPVRRSTWSISPYTFLVAGIVLTIVSLPVIIFLPWVRLTMSLLTTGYAVACVIMIGWIAFWGLRRHTANEKQFIRVLAVGIVFLLFAQALSHKATHYNSLVLNSFTHIFTIPLALLPIVCSYALVRHQLLGKTSLISRQVMRVILWILLTSFFTVPTIIFIHNLESSIASREIRDYLIAGLILLSLWLFPPAWNRVRNIGDQVFYHDFYEYNRSLRELSAELTHLQHLDQICTFILPRLDTLLNSTGAALLVRTEGHSKGMVGEGSQMSSWRIYLNSEEPFFPIDRLTEIANLALASLKHRSDEPLLLDGVLLLALYDGDHLSGFLCLGPKLNFEPYTRQDKSFLATLAAQLSALEVNSRYLELAQANSQQLTALNRRVVSVQENERKRLSLELHDEALQQAMLLVRQLADASNMTDIAETMPLARSLMTSLRHTCLELRPPLLDELGLQEALSWLARQTEQRAGQEMLHVIVACINTEGTRLPQEVELALYRVAQEALSNVLKHARASTVVMRFRHTEHGHISVLICDNGQGFIKGQTTSECLGLVGMYERMTAVGGQLQLRTSLGRGTMLRATYTIPALENEGTHDLVSVDTLVMSS